jgi:diguanylate cyclase (GGDEF)-like protein
MSREINSRDSVLFPILDRVSDAIVVAAPAPWRAVYANPVALSWLSNAPEGNSTASTTDRPLAAIFEQKAPSELLARIEQFWQGGAAEATLAIDLSDDDSSIPSRVQMIRLVTDGRPLLGIVGHTQPNAADHAAPCAPDRLDPLTGLPDRTFLLSRLAELMRGERTTDRPFAVLFVDLDNFKQVNDAEGHLVGDRVLGEVARRLASCVREGDHVARYGGDEFVVLVERVAAPADIEPIIRRIHAVLAKPIATLEGDVSLSVSIGSAEASPEYRRPEDVLAAADRAMYAAKRSNG